MYLLLISTFTAIHFSILNALFVRKSSLTHLKELITIIGPSAKYRPISYLYHVTKSKQSVIDTRTLMGSMACMTRPPSNQSPIHNTLQGVFFSCNLVNDGLQLPNMSPFGSDRVIIPVTEFADPTLHLFYNSHHYTESSICYVVLVLAKEGDPYYAYCRDRMIMLNIETNEILKLDFKNNSFQYCDPSAVKIWVEIFVVGNVSLMNMNHSWDTVQKWTTYM